MEVFFLKTNGRMDLPELVKDFLRYIDVIKNKSATTVAEYALDLRTFVRYVAILKGLVEDKNELENLEKVDISGLGIDFFKDISLNDAYSFLSYCKNERDNSPSTRARKVAAVRAFFKFLTTQQKLLDENPMAELDTPKIKKSLPKYLTLEQSIDLLSCIDGKNRQRDYCIITLFLNCGMRLSELVSLNYTDIRSNGTMRVTGKGNKERTIYLNSACLEAISDYMSVRPVDGVIDKNALFLSNRLKRISPKTVQYIVKTFIDKSGLGGQGFSVHKLRHTAATLMYQHGNVDVLVLKDILGHENLGTTEIYTHILDEQLKNASDANPLANVKFKKNTIKLEKK